MKHFASIGCTIVTTAIFFSSLIAPQAETFRPVVRGKRGAVAAGHPLSAEAGMRLLQQGGNAVDAGCAALLAASVIEISHFSFGGEVPIIIKPSKAKPVVINGQGIAPKLATREFFLERAKRGEREEGPVYTGAPEYVSINEGGARPGTIPSSGILPATVPGILDAVVVALDTYGTKSLAEVMQPAIEMADGFPIDELRVSYLERTRGGIMNIHSTNTVGDLAVAIPGATRVFEALGIDYCCGGNRTLDEVCRISNLAVGNVMRSLTQAEPSIPANEPTQDWQQTSLAALLAYIVDMHHVFTRNELTRLEALINKVYSVHGQNHAELLKLQTLFQTIKEDLLPHMLKEEQVLFPYIEQLEKAVFNSEPVARPFFGTVQNPVRMMMFEHDTVGEILVEMREVTSNYTVPPEGCISYKTLYQALQDFEYDLHQHIHLENNLLFPRAIEIESRMKIIAEDGSSIEQNGAACCI